MLTSKLLRFAEILGRRQEIAKLLIEAGTSVNVLDQHCETAMDSLRFQPIVAADGKWGIGELLRARGGLTDKQLVAKRQVITAPPDYFGVADSPKRLTKSTKCSMSLAPTTVRKHASLRTGRRGRGFN